MENKDIKTYLEKGTEALSNFQLFSAQEEIEKGKLVDEKNIDIKLLEGKVFGALNLIHDAIEKLTEVIDENPQCREALVERGYFKVRAGDLIEGYEDLKSAVALDESNVDGKLTLAKVCLDLERFEEAREVYKELLKSYAPSVIGNNFVSTNKFIIRELENKEFLSKKEKISLAESYFYINDSEKSLDIIKDIEVECTDYEELINIGKIYASNEHISKSIEFYDTAIGLDPKKSKAYILKGSALKSIGKNLESYNVLRNIVSLDGIDNEVYLTLSKVAFKLGKYNEALNYCDKSIEAECNVHSSHYLKACIHNRMCRYEEGNKEIDKALNIYTGDGDYYAEKSASLRGRGYMREANDVCEKALEYRLETAKINLEKGLILKNVGYYENAVSWLDVAIDMDPEDIAGKFYKAICCYYLENYGESKSLLNEIKEVTKKEALIYGLEIMINNAMENEGWLIGILDQYAEANGLSRLGEGHLSYRLIEEIESVISPLKCDEEYKSILEEVKKILDIK